MRARTDHQVRTCYTHARTDHRAAILGLSVYRSRRNVTNTDPLRWALQRHCALRVQGSPSLSFFCGGCQYYCHPNDNRISRWVYSNAVIYGGYGTVQRYASNAMLKCR